MPASEAQQRAVAKYMKKNYDDIKLRVCKGQRTLIQEHAAQRGESANAFIIRAIAETIEHDNTKKD